MGMETRKGLPYAIDFNTKEIPGQITAVTVGLNKILLGKSDEVRVDLVDHPLYHRLEQYVLANPSPRRTKSGK